MPHLNHQDFNRKISPEDLKKTPSGRWRWEEKNGAQKRKCHDSEAGSGQRAV